MKQTVWTLIIYPVLLTSLLALSMGCSSNDAPMNGPENPDPENPSVEQTQNVLKPIELTEGEKQINQEMPSFSFNFFRNVLQDEEIGDKAKENMLVSPLSASIALCMTANGANGETRNEILKALGFSSASISEVNSYNAKLTAALATMDTQTTVALANSLWLNKGFTPLKSYMQTLNDSFGADIFETELTTALPQINKWCKEKTNGMIKDFLKRLPNSSKLVLLNALYFNGKWTRPFDTQDTETEYFCNEAGEQISRVKMMKKKAATDYMQNESYALANLTFGNTAFSMYFLLPNQGVTLTQCIKTLDGTTWAKALEAMEERKLNLQVPRFSAEVNEELTSTMKALGINKAFAANADFSNLSSEQLAISAVQQACSIKVQEEGAEAAAVTGVEMDATVVPDPNQPIDFFLNRPFLYVIAEKSTGTMLFVGQMTKL